MPARAASSASGPDARAPAAGTAAAAGLGVGDAVVAGLGVGDAAVTGFGVGDAGPAGVRDPVTARVAVGVGSAAGSTVLMAAARAGPGAGRRTGRPGAGSCRP